MIQKKETGNVVLDKRGDPVTITIHVPRQQWDNLIGLSDKRKVSFLLGRLSLLYLEEKKP